MVNTTYQVQGMTCGHCVSAVGAIAGVREVRVDLAGGLVTVSSDQPLDPAVVRAAVDEAGYDLVEA
ncbi:heavy-metal-associated domain-containing protein [Micromonospora tarensis]|uniref:Heavy-metal-associated domain-containing protein n=1 Tax=Micromonospora tarensis TaxID=2806100 RepID=A0ABS1YB74_9ACTN|nr:cation transporter [Micromonospora tarensis]MBM0274640.1 heavy-metal-associated domain-containing protein [Micromonospora tarensis]